MSKNYRELIRTRTRRVYSRCRPNRRWSPIPLSLVLAFLMAAPLVDELPASRRRVLRAQELVEELRLALALKDNVQLSVVPHHPLVFSVEPARDREKGFRLSMELRFLQLLDEDELRAALAHELGHVWIFSNHPFLQTERLANEIGQRVVKRNSLEKVYTKLWKFEGRSGVEMDQLLGPLPEVPRVLVAEPPPQSPSSSAGGRALE